MMNPNPNQNHDGDRFDFVGNHPGPLCRFGPGGDYTRDYTPRTGTPAQEATARRRGSRPEFTVFYVMAALVVGVPVLVFLALWFGAGVSLVGWCLGTVAIGGFLKSCERIDRSGRRYDDKYYANQVTPETPETPKAKQYPEPPARADEPLMGTGRFDQAQSGRGFLDRLA